MLSETPANVAPRFWIFDCRARMSAVVDLGIRALFSCCLLLSGPYLHGAYRVDNRAPVEDCGCCKHA